MSRYQNHCVDPFYFYDAIELFTFEYDWYVQIDKSIDDYGNVSYKYDKRSILGSFQSEGLRVNFSKSGNTHLKTYNFYCKSLYRINEGDFIVYNNNFYRVDGITNDYDEYGVRGATLTMVQLTQYRDLQEYIKYLNGEITV